MLFMKRLILFIITLLCFINVMAQEQDPWVGTWTSESYTDMDWENSPRDSEGSFQEIIKTDYKRVIRITKHDNQYSVRAKTIKVSDPTYSSYHKSLKITRVEDNTIWLQSFVSKLPFTVDYGYGTFIESYSDVTYYYKLTLNNGILHYSYYKYHSVDYDRNMRRTGESSENVSGAGYELDLFNDDW